MNRKLSILGNEPRYPNGQPPYNTITELELEAVSAVVRRGELSGFVASPTESFWGGSEVRALESDFANFFGCERSLSFNSATSALHAGLWALCLEPGDEVIVPPYTMSASATTVLMVGGVPIFADIEDRYFCMDHTKLETLLTNRTRAVMVVNLFGHPAELHATRAFCDKHNLFMIEDNSQAPGAIFNGSFAGTVSDIGIFSLNRHKTIQSGEGGVALVKQQELYERMAFLRNHGESVAEEFGYSDAVNTGGLNLRMTEMEAAVARQQLLKLTSLNVGRIQLANRLKTKLEQVHFLTAPETQVGCEHVYYVAALKFDERKAGISRDLFVEALAAENYRVRAGYLKPLYLNKIYQNRTFLGSGGFPFSENARNFDNVYKPGVCPVCENIEKEKLIIADILYSPLSDKFIDNFVEDCQNIVANKDRLLSHM